MTIGHIATQLAKSKMSENSKCGQGDEAIKTLFYFKTL